MTLSLLLPRCSRLVASSIALAIVAGGQTCPPPPFQCVPSVTGQTESNTNLCAGTASNGICAATITKSVTYYTSYYNGHTASDAALGKGRAGNTQMCEGSATLKPVYNECWPQFDSPVATTGQLRVTTHESDIVALPMFCGDTGEGGIGLGNAYNEFFACSQSSPGVTYYIPKVPYDCCSGGCSVMCGTTCADAKIASCRSYEHYSCQGNTPQCCGNCNDGSTDCKVSCGNVCGSMCIDCFHCTGNLQYNGCSNGQPQCTGTPIVLDPFDRGFRLTSVANGVKFRTFPSGPLSQMSWTDPSWQNGWLVLDRNGNGTIDDFTELFGSMTAQPPNEEPNGFLALAVFDDPANGGNGNGVIDPGDAIYRHLRVWIDANHNGVSEPNELYTLQALGIFKIGLKFHNTPFVDQYGNEFRYRGTVWDQGGHGRDVCYDVLLHVQVNSEGI